MRRTCTIISDSACNTTFTALDTRKTTFDRELFMTLNFYNTSHRQRYNDKSYLHKTCEKNKQYIVANFR